ncbi:MAG: endopeptidase La [Spirochaetales bacterium]|nr:endopeptidase La [Spirochaetales bacterium]
MDIEAKKQELILPLFDSVLFPGVRTKITVGKAVRKALEERENISETPIIALTVREKDEKGRLGIHSFYDVGTLIKIEQAVPNDKGGFLLHIESLTAVTVHNMELRNKQFFARFEQRLDEFDLSREGEDELLKYIHQIIRETGEHLSGADDFIKPLLRMDSLNNIIANVLPYLQVDIYRKQVLLEETSQRSRAMNFIDMLILQKEAFSIQMEIAQKFQEKNNSQYRKNMLREQMKAIQAELNEGKADGKDDYLTRIEKAAMPEEAEKAAREELTKQQNMESNSPEYNKSRDYLELLLSLPWKKGEAPEIDLNQARALLEEEHYGLEKVKDRIIQHLAVMKLKKEKQGSILLLVGPPGTGKTSLGKSIAKALGRPYERLSLGGVRDEAELRGHRRTYVGALPGRIIRAMKKAGQRNPVFVLDEVDKVSSSHGGDPFSALLEILDPEQNSAFSDHYLEVPFDLSDVFFIATANSLNSIPAPLLDRTEVIQINGYTNPEKFQIARNHLVDKTLEEHGLDKSKMKFTDGALKQIIEKYTREAGVRGLGKQIAAASRYASEKIVSGTVELPFTVKKQNLNEVLGRELIRQDDANKSAPAGVVTGLAWTPVGGDILFIEGTFMPGSGGLTLTGQLGDVMKESARISLSLVRSRLADRITHFDFIKNDIHIHVPAGSTPKDGPSAGVTLFTAIASLVTGKAVDTKLAMTGEITLRGSVLPIGGLKEKVIAAHRAGIEKVLIPKANEGDLEDIPEEIREEIKFIPVDRVEDVLKEALGIKLKKGIMSNSLLIPPKAESGEVIAKGR